MRTLSITLLLIVLLSACTVSQPTATPSPIPTLEIEPLTGEWLGGFIQSDGKVFSLLINFTEDTANFNIQPFTKSWVISDYARLDQHIKFSVIGKAPDQFEQIHFEGQLSNGELAGTLNWDDTSYQVVFVPLFSINSTILQKYVGVYRFESGRMVSVLLSPSYDDGRLQYFPPGLMFTDLSSGDSRGLYPLDDISFAVGSARVLAYPLERDRIQFLLNAAGEVSVLKSIDNENSEKIETAFRINYSVEDVTFTSADGARMVGLLTSPTATTGLHPAFMMMHGSEPGVKDGFGQQILAHYMVSQGIALLTYDKRGVGGSEGVYRERPDDANLKLIASDAVAGVAYLSTRPEIDPAKVGLIGGSQAGWVIPIAAAESEKVAFFVIQSGPVVSFAQEDYFSTITNDGDTATTYDAEKLDQTLRAMNRPDNAPIAGIKELNQPGLWLWGSVDRNVPATVSEENLQLLIDSGKDNFSYAMLSGGDHNLNQSAHGYFTEIPYSPRVVYFSELTNWLKKNNIVSKE